MMNQICREQFVALHSMPLLENLSKFFLDNYGYNQKYKSSSKLVLFYTLFVIIFV